MVRIPARIQSALLNTGLPWTIKNGKKHQKIFLGGILVGVISHSAHYDGEWVAIKNIVGQIRRKAKELTSDLASPRAS